ncbi:MAG: response regulator [Thermoguttaceae bacterium]|nr:response regulator [Thermoguttaceae bacterium]MDW8037857.1 response regulator [Thermoguttaceae bacterium]
MRPEVVGRPMEILLVEDNLEDAGLAIQALREGGLECRISLVRDGQEALDFLHRRGIYARAPKPDLVLLDLYLPKKDGREVLAEIRADQHLRWLSVVVLTASQLHEEILRREQLAVDGYLVKPIDFPKFIALVKQLRQSWLKEVILPPLD